MKDFLRIISLYYFVVSNQINHIHIPFQNFKIKGGKSFQFEQNSVEVINDLVFDLINLKNVHINGNNMGFSLKSPNGLLFLDQNRQAKSLHRSRADLYRGSTAYAVFETLEK